MNILIGAIIRLTWTCVLNIRVSSYKVNLQSLTMKYLTKYIAILKLPLQTVFGRSQRVLGVGLYCDNVIFTLKLILFQFSHWYNNKIYRFTLLLIIFTIIDINKLISYTVVWLVKLVIFDKACLLKMSSVYVTFSFWIIIQPSSSCLLNGSKLRL